MKTNILLYAIMARCLLAAGAAQLRESTFTEIMKEVDLLPAITKTRAPATLNQLVKAPDIVRTAANSGAVLGTTLLVAATDDGGFKVILLEGRGRVTLPNGRSVGLRAGQIVYVLPSGNGFSGVLDVNLAKLVAGSLLLTGFSHELPSARLIQDAVQRQSGQLAKGRVEDTGISADSFARRKKVGNGLGALDNNTYSTLTLPVLQR